MKNNMQKNSIQKTDDYRDIYQKEKTYFLNSIFNMLAIYEQLSKLDLNYTQIYSEANSSYRSAMWDKHSVYPKIESGFGFKPYMNDVYQKHSVIKHSTKMVMNLR